MSDEALKTRAVELTEEIRAQGEVGNLKAANELLKALRDDKQYDALIELAEVIGRVAPDAPTPRRYYAQALINTRRVTAAIDVLEAVKARLPVKAVKATRAAKGKKGKKVDAKALAEDIFEVTGLLGRSYKQIYFDARNRGSATAREALRKSIAAYGDGYRANPRENTWHGVNLLALIEHCRRTGLPYPKEFAPKPLAKALLSALAAIKNPDAWNLATIAEATLGTDDWSKIADSLVRYTNARDVTAFHIDSTLRQFREVWRLEDDPRGKPLLDVLSAFMMTLPGASVTKAAKECTQQKIPAAEHFEATLGNIKGTQSREWMMNALAASGGVAAIRQKLAGRVGTGFLVSAKSIGLDRDENLVLTNFHVVNHDGVTLGEGPTAMPTLAPDAAEVVFEAIDPTVRYPIAEVLCESPPEECDFCLLRLAQPVAKPAPLTIAGALPALQPEPPQAQVFVIGHPLGKELTYSFQDNELIDHEGPKAGKPPNPASCRVHYRAPTEKGNSGSPVFNSLWQVIALHHSGGKAMAKLNGKKGQEPANEGIWMQSIIEMIRGKMLPALKGAA